MKREHNLVSLVLSCLAAWLIASALIGIVAVEGALHIPRKPLESADERLAQAIGARNKSAMSEVAIRAEDGAILSAWSFIPLGGNGNAVILLHGQGDNRAGMLGNAELLLERGYSVLLPDARAHGESGGSIVTYGVEEKGDLVRWYNWLEQAQAPHCIYGLGESMGAAVLLQAVAKEPEFCAVVAESSFVSFREAAYIRLGEEFHAGPWLGRTLLRPAVETGLVYARLRYGVNLALASPIKAVAASRVPIFLIHGLADTNIPPYNSERMKAANPTIELWELVGANHCGAAAAAPEEYQRLVIAWFKSHT
ncbi:MAG: alpha/beta hydrolase [Terracidiphilus sp.]